MKAKTVAGALGIVALVVVGCSGSDPEPVEAPTVTVTATETVTAPPPPPVEVTVTETVTPEYEAGVDLTDEIALAGLANAWDRFSGEDQEKICELWDIAPTVIISQYLDGRFGDEFNEELVVEFFNGVCT